jgi:hypothetical protein
MAGVLPLLTCATMGGHKGRRQSSWWRASYVVDLPPQ